MSIFGEIEKDLQDVFAEGGEFTETHNVNGTSMLAIVHSTILTSRSSIVSMINYGADRVCIVRRSDYGDTLPPVGMVFFLDDVEYSVSDASYLGERAVKVSLNRPDTNRESYGEYD